MAKLTDEEREVVMNALLEEGHIEEDDTESLSSLSDKAFVAFADNLLNNSSDDEDEEEYDDDEEAEDDEEEEVTDNSEPVTHMCASCKKEMKKKKQKLVPMDEEEEMAENQEMSVEEWMNTAPSEVAVAVQNAMNIVNERKAKLIEQITANVDDKAKKVRMIKRLTANTVEELEDLASTVTTNSSPAAPVKVPGVRRNFAGASTPNGKPTTNNRKSEPLVPPTIDWKELQSEFSASNN